MKMKGASAATGRLPVSRSPARYMTGAKANASRALESTSEFGRLAPSGIKDAARKSIMKGYGRWWPGSSGSWGGKLAP